MANTRRRKTDPVIDRLGRRYTVRMRSDGGRERDTTLFASDAISAGERLCKIERAPPRSIVSIKEAR